MPNDLGEIERRFFQIKLRSVFLLITLAAIVLAAYVLWKKINFKFEAYDDYYQVEMIDKIEFQRHHCHVYVILEDGRTTPTLRQRWLIYKLQRYSDTLSEAIDDAADEHRIDFEGAVGNLTEEYGLPVMNRQNIAEHYWVGGIEIPRLSGSQDDFIVLGCDCTWEEEHGMQILVKNGENVVWQGEEGPWEWEKPWEFLAKRKAKSAGIEAAD